MGYFSVGEMLRRRARSRENTHAACDCAAADADAALWDAAAAAEEEA